MNLNFLYIEILPIPSKYHQGDVIQSPEARNYVAYIPVPINNEDEDEEEYGEDYEDEEYYDEDYEDEEDEYYEDDDEEVRVLIFHHSHNFKCRNFLIISLHLLTLLGIL